MDAIVMASVGTEVQCDWGFKFMKNEVLILYTTSYSTHFSHITPFLYLTFFFFFFFLWNYFVFLRKILLKITSGIILTLRHLLKMNLGFFFFFLFFFFWTLLLFSYSGLLMMLFKMLSKRPWTVMKNLLLHVFYFIYFIYLFYFGIYVFISGQIAVLSYKKLGRTALKQVLSLFQKSCLPSFISSDFPIINHPLGKIECRWFFSTNYSTFFCTR